MVLYDLESLKLRVKTHLQTQAKTVFEPGIEEKLFSEDHDTDSDGAKFSDMD